MSIQSRIDPNINFRHNEATVTITHKKTHAQLVHEVVMHGQYRMSVCDLVGNNTLRLATIRSFDINPNDLQMDNKSKTWVIGIREFRRMQDSIHEEFTRDKIVFFQNVGRYSTFASNMVDYQPRDDELIHFKKTNPFIFNKLCQIVRDTRSQDLPFGTDACADVVENTRKRVRFQGSTNEFPNLAKIIIAILDGQSPWNDTLLREKHNQRNGSAQTTKKITQLVKHLPGIWDEDFSFCLKGIRISSENKVRSVIHLVQSLRTAFSHNEISNISQLPHNCSSWVMEKLQIAGVPVKIPTWHCVASGPRELVRENKEGNMRPADCVIS